MTPVRIITYSPVQFGPQFAGWEENAPESACLEDLTEVPDTCKRGAGGRAPYYWHGNITCRIVEGGPDPAGDRDARRQQYADWLGEYHRVGEPVFIDRDPRRPLRLLTRDTCRTVTVLSAAEAARYFDL